MTWLVETPWPAIIGAVVVEAILAIALLRTGLVKIVGAMIAAPVIAVLLVVLERVVVTEFEEVEGTLDGAATAIERNDVERVLALIAPENKQVRQNAERAMRQFTFSEARVGNDLKVQINPLTSPRSAKVSFSAKLTAQDRRGDIGGTQLVPVELTLHKVGGRWYVAEYQLHR
jgi:hypothetical protein